MTVTRIALALGILNIGNGIAGILSTDNDNRPIYLLNIGLGVALCVAGVVFSQDLRRLR